MRAPTPASAPAPVSPLKGIGFGLPLGAGRPGFDVGPTGGIALVEGDGCIRQDLLLLLLTVPGERVMRPAYGCHLDRLLFQPNDETLAGLAIHYVGQAIARFEPRVEVLEIGAKPGEAGEANRLEITLRYRVKRSRVEDEIALSLDLDGGDA